MKKTQGLEIKLCMVIIAKTNIIGRKVDVLMSWRLYRFLPNPQKM